MNVNCLSCGHLLDLRDAYDNYEGQVRCFICGSLLSLHSEDGQVKVGLAVATPAGAGRGGQQRQSHRGMRGQ